MNRSGDSSISGGNSNFGKNRATIAIVDKGMSNFRRSMSESDLDGLGVAELIESVTPSLNVSIKCINDTFIYNKSIEKYKIRALGIEKRIDWFQLGLIMMKGSCHKAMNFWLNELRKSTEEEEDTFIKMDCSFAIKEENNSNHILTSEELMEKISPESSKLLREILNNSWEEIELRKKENCESVNKKGKGICDCSFKNEKLNEGFKRPKPLINGLEQWENILHLAKFHKDLGEIEQDFQQLTLSENDEWLSSQDSEGKIYYYEENSTNSSWFLPVPTLSTNPNESSEKSTLERENHNDVSNVITPRSSPKFGSPLVKKRYSAGEVSDRHKARSLLIMQDSRKAVAGIGSLPRSNHHKSIWLNSNLQEDSSLKVIREGSLCRTKISENGKKVRKNWSSSYIVLTEEHLSLFKDEKTFGSKKSDLEIELSGCTSNWSLDKTSRKNAFQLNTSNDLQMLFQSDDAENSKEWLENIQDVIRRQPVRQLLRLRSTNTESLENYIVGEKKSSRLGRAKSTKLKISGSIENLTSDERNKIKAHLKKFFHRRPGRESLVKKGIYKDEAVFGCSLDKLCQREGRDVPSFVQEAIASIESKEDNLKTDGIYRASGNLSQVQKIRLQVDQNNLSCLYQEEDVHVLAGALKLFFREMREPLIATDLFTEALNAATSNLSKKVKIEKFRDIISQLGKPNRATLYTLLKHLIKVSEYGEYNRMLIPNLAIVFGPTLMWPANESSNMALDLMQQNYVIEALLLDFEAIFEKR